MKKIQKGEGKIKSFDPEGGRLPRRGNVEDEDAWEEEEGRNYRKISFNMAYQFDKLFAEYEKEIMDEKDLEDHASVHH